MKKFVSLLLTVVMFATMLTVFAVPASADRNRTTFAGNAAYIGKWADFTYPGKGYNGVVEFCYIVGVNDMGYNVAIYKRCGSEWQKSTYESNLTSESFLGLVSTESIPAEVRAVAEKDYPNLSTGSALSNGTLWIVIAVAVVALGGVATLVIVKKKKKPAVADGE